MYQIRAATRPEILPVLPNPHYLMILNKLGMVGPCIAIVPALRTQNIQRMAWVIQPNRHPILPKLDSNSK